MRVLIITVSDRCSRGEVEDQSGPRARDILQAHFQTSPSPLQCRLAIVPDDIDRITRAIKLATDTVTDLLVPHLILLTGGTGFAPRDVTPEAVRPLLEKEAPGIIHMMLSESLQVTKFAWLSRAVAGVRRRTLIITLPGSPKAVAECLQPLLDNGLEHAVRLASGEADHKHPTGAAAIASPRPTTGSSDATPPPPPLPPSAATLPTTHGSSSPRTPRTTQAPLEPNQLTPRRATGLPGASSTTTPRRTEAIDPVRSPTNTAASAAALTTVPPAKGDRVRVSPFPMVEMDAALSLIRTQVPSTLGITTLPIQEAAGCVLAQDIVSEFPHPPFRASVKDGYAVRARDGPGVYPVVGALTAGATGMQSMPPLSICRVNTGGMVPDDADAVVQVEDTRGVVWTAEGEEAHVEILKGATVGQDIRPVGCDLPAKGVAVPAGTVIGAAEIGLAYSAGVPTVHVRTKPIVAVISTGDELSPIPPVGTSRRPPTGKIYDSNKAMLLAALAESGYEAEDGGLAKDEHRATRDAMERAMMHSDVILTTGGVSMGEVDFVKHVLVELGATIHFGRVNMKPGKPTTFATLGKKVFFGLPGNPVSAMVCYHLFVVPALQRMAGLNDAPCIVQAISMDRLRLDRERPEYHRCQLKWDPMRGGFTASSTGIQASHRLLSLAGANGLMVLPVATDEQPAVEPNSTVSVMVIGKF